jgi:hypothetical protein
MSIGRQRLRHRDEAAETRRTEAAGRSRIRKGAAAMTIHASFSALRRVAPVLGGFIVVVSTTTVTDIVLHASGIFPPWGERMADVMFVVPLGYRIVYAIVGGYLAARLATARPLSHAVVLGAIGFALSAIGTVATIGQSAVYGPAWYALLVTATALPCSFAGGKLYTRGARSLTPYAPTRA